MARKFGDYIHLHWQNYYNHGTYRNKEKKTNYSSQLFNKHYENLKATIASSSILPEERKRIAAEYNKRNTEAWQFFAALDKTNIIDRGVLTFLLQQINKTWTSQFVNQIIDGLKWDDNKKTFIFSPPPSIRKSYATKSASWPALTLDTNAGFHYFYTIKNYITNTAIKYLDTLEAENGATDTTIEDKQELTKLINELKIHEDILKNWNLSEQQLYLLIKSKIATKDQQIFLKNILKKYFENIVMPQVNNIREKYISAEEVNRQIQAAIAEICGNIVATTSVDIAEEEIYKMLKEALSIGKTGSDKDSTITVDGKNIMSLNAKTVLRNDQALKVTKLSGKAKNGSLRYAFTDLGQTRQQKRDIELTIEEQTYGISMKNTNFTNALSQYDAKKQGLHASTISLQNSSLMLYLMGIEATNPTWGTHYLNALVQHEDLNNIVKVQEQALRNLKLYILYSALTGKGQLRDKKGAAQILAIYDKAKNAKGGVRVRLYDMSDILLAIEKTQFKEGVKFSPSIDKTFLIDNKYVSEIENRQPVDVRLTQVLIDARNKNISASLYTSWLRDNSAIQYFK